MTAHTDRCRAFHRLHERGCFVMSDPWDLGSALALAVPLVCGLAAWAAAESPSRPARVPPAVAGACDLAHEAAAATPGTAITRRTRWSREDVPVHPVAGCGLDVRGSFARAGAADAPSRLRTTFADRGWRELPDYAADGKDGTAFAFTKRGVTCLVRGVWDGGADGEPEIPAADWYKVFVFCTDGLPGPD